jgi:hypothetical protein
MFVQFSASACSLMQRIQDRFVVSAWPSQFEEERYRPNEFFLQAADILLHYDTLASDQIKHVIYAGHAWHQREHGRSTHQFRYD